MWGSLGVEHMNSHEQLCPQYLLRTDDMEYHIRPLDLSTRRFFRSAMKLSSKLRKTVYFSKYPTGIKRNETTRWFPWSP
jgi:hypothetical protein